MVDERRVRRLLQRILDDVAFLAERRAEGAGAIRADPVRLAAVKYVFVTAIEASLDVAQHVCAS